MIEILTDLVLSWAFDILHVCINSIVLGKSASG